MIRRLAGAYPNRSRAVAYGRVVWTVATARVKAPSLYEQACDALAVIDHNLADAGTDKSRLISATVYITDMRQKPELNRAWDEWVDFANPPQRACVGVALEGD